MYTYSNSCKYQIWFLYLFQTLVALFVQLPSPVLPFSWFSTFPLPPPLYHTYPSLQLLSAHPTSRISLQLFPPTNKIKVVISLLHELSLTEKQITLPFLIGDIRTLIWNFLLQASSLPTLFASQDRVNGNTGPSIHASYSLETPPHEGLRDAQCNRANT